MPVVIATILREEGVTGVHTHVHQFRRYLATQSESEILVTPFSWRRRLACAIFAVNFLLKRCSGSTAVVWYLFWHELFLYRALRRNLVKDGNWTIYAQSPTAARAALRARLGEHQRVIMAVHFTASGADEFASEHIRHGGRVFHAIRRMERDIIPKLDGIVFVSKSSQRSLLEWLPEASTVPSVVIGNFIAPTPPLPQRRSYADIVSIGALRALKNHRFLLEVLVEAKRVGRTVTLDVFGQGQGRKELMELTKSLGLEQEVRWRGFSSNVRDFLPGYKIYVHSSHSEALPLAIIEAMAAGLPVIAGKVGGISEMGNSGMEIRFWPLDDPATAADILLDLLDCEPSRQEASSAASLRFSRDFDVTVAGARLLSFLQGELAMSVLNGFTEV
jgi:glycosyltransferase involved in cell wall biosynthesis